MAESNKQYRTVVGFVQFPPREGEAGGKPIRNITVRTAGFREQAVRVSATLWPSHENVKVEEGDLVALEGSYTQNKSTNEETGETRTFHNISVSRISVLGQGDAGKRVDTVNTDDADADDSDIPF